jgi:glycosyltransferase involved in cell wall biosynthesis
VHREDELSLVSVVIPTYNAARFVAGAIKSVLDQTMPDFEIVIVDDGSSDDTAGIVEPFLADSRVRYVYQKNRGLPGARNAGAQISNGEFLAFLDADDFFAPNALETMHKVLSEAGSAWLNVGVLKIDGEKRTVRNPCIPVGDLLLAVLTSDFITRSPFYPRREFFAIGMYDEGLRMREDWDLNIRMIEAGRPMTVVAEPLYHYSRVEGSITTGNLEKLFFYTGELLGKHHKKLADAGNRAVANIYAENMWDLARRYFYELGDVRRACRCIYESLCYDVSVSRLVHPLVHRLKRGFTNSNTMNSFG